MTSPLSTIDRGARIPLGPRDAGIPMDLDEFEAAEFEPAADKYRGS